MGFLGKIGIDWQLIVAQIVNFAILVWIFARFVYKPLLKGMESGELEQAERGLAEVKQERAKIVQEKKAATDEAKRKSAELVKEAEVIAAKVQEKVREEAVQERQKMAEQFKLQAGLQKKEAAGKMAEEIGRRIGTSLSDGLKRSLADKGAASALQKAYYAALVEDLGTLKPSDLDLNDSHVAVTYALAPEKGRLDELKKAVAAKLGGSAFKIGENKDPELLAGYRLELAGVIIEKSLSNDIRHALEESRKAP